jgi:two-component system cell cycle sensor histidine kinase/response regulator CckA
MVDEVDSGLAASAWRREIEAARRRAQALRSECSVRADAEPWIRAALDELAATIEELQVADEEVHVVNAALLDARNGEEAMRRRYHDLFTNAPCAYLVTDLNGAIVEVNRAAAELLGRRAELLAGKPLTVFVAVPQRRDLRLLTRALAIGAERSVTNRVVGLVDSRGTTRSFALSAAPVLGADGKVATLRWVLQDISDQVNAQQGLRQSEHTLRAAERAAHMGTFEFDFRSGSDHWSEGTFELLGVRNDGDALPIVDVVQKLVHPDDRDLVWRALDRVIADGARFDVEFRVLRADGVVRHLHMIGEPHREPGGKVASLSGALHDVSSRRLAEAAAAAAERKARFVLESASQGFIGCDERGIIDSFNGAAEQIFGYRRDEVIGADISLLFATTPEGSDEPTAHATGDRGRRKDGTTFAIEITAADVEIDGRTCVFRLVRDLGPPASNEASARQLADAESLSRLACGVVHDVNNLLSTVLGRARLLHGSLEGDERQRHVDDIARAATHAGAIARNLLSPTRRHGARRRPIDPNTVVRDTLALFANLIDPSIAVDLAPEPALGLVDIAAAQLGQIVMNLALNARDAMPQGGRLRFATANVDVDAEVGAASVPGSTDGPGHLANPDGLPPGRWVMLSVTDTGTGIDEVVRARMFEPWFTTKPGGSGLGMTMVRTTIVENHGEIRIDSTPGGGTTVRVYLPRSKATRTKVRADRQVHRAAASCLAKTVLLVDDHDRGRTVLAEILEEEGHRPITAHDGLEALRQCEHSAAPIDVLVTDVRMPRMDGRELAAKLRARWPQLHVVFMSGLSPEDAHASEVPGAIFLQKPFGAEELLRAIAAARTHHAPPRRAQRFRTQPPAAKQSRS